MTIFGWDASDFDWDRGPMDLAAARADGIDWFTHKATEGTHVRHTRYGEALHRARDAGIPILGAYQVVRSDPPIQAQVDYLLEYLDERTPWWRTMREFILQVDLEHWEYDEVDPELGVAMCEALQSQTGHWAVLYAPKWAYGNSIGGDDPLWASNYGDNPAVHFFDAYPGDDSSRWDEYSGRVPTFLQYGSRTTIGSQPTCDANAYRGTITDLWSLVTGNQPIDTGGKEMTGAVVSDGKSIVVAWIDPVLGPVWRNLYDTAYLPMWAAMGFTGDPAGNAFVVSDLAVVGQEFSAAQVHWANLQATGGGDDVDVLMEDAPL